MDDEKLVTVPYIVHEGIQVRLERTIKRLVYALILTILLMFASNGLWLYAWMQYDYESEESTTTTTHTNTNTVDVNSLTGAATYVGDIINGTDNRDDNGNDNKIDNEAAQAETQEEWPEQGNP